MLGLAGSRLLTLRSGAYKRVELWFGIDLDNKISLGTLSSPPN